MLTNSNCILSKRPVHPDRALFLQKQFKGLSNLEAQLFSARGVEQAPPTLKALTATPMLDLRQGAKRLLSAIIFKEQITVVADYDCDGATACAVMVAGLRALGGRVDYVVPDRMVHGYGISASVVDLAREKVPNTKVLVTVDNGVLGHSGIAYAGTQGMEVIVTDHHLPGDSRPDAVAVIDPAQRDCSSGLVNLAGVAVALWLVLAVKHELAKTEPTPSLNFLLPYVAIGTIADMVKIDINNHQLVKVGLNLIRGKQAPTGILALIEEAKLKPEFITTGDIGFTLGPRINAAGRLKTMNAGIDLLLESDEKKAKSLARILTETNEERKKLQNTATEEVQEALLAEEKEPEGAIVRASDQWHPGIIGLIASRLKEAYHLPSFVFSIENEKVKGSGRSIPGFHLKDSLEEIVRRDPDLLLQFGGHAMAAGATLTGIRAIEPFTTLFREIAVEKITPEMKKNILLSDGKVPELSTEDGMRLLRHPWGQGFEPPAFDEEAKISQVRPLGKDGKHWKIQAILQESGQTKSIVLFNQKEPEAGSRAHLYLQPSLNTWNEETNIQWIGRII